MSRLSPAVRWWVLPGATAMICTAFALLNFALGSWAVGFVLVVLAFNTLLSRRTETYAYRAGYWRGSYEEMTSTRPPGSWDGWQPSPWDDPPPPPWEVPIRPTKH